MATPHGVDLDFLFGRPIVGAIAIIIKIVIKMYDPFVMHFILIKILVLYFQTLKFLTIAFKADSLLNGVWL